MVWNIKAQEKRLVELTPNDDWGGAGLLGVTIRLDNYGGADERLIRVLEVEDDSPAAVAGLVPMKDFLLGTTATAFGSSEVLAAVLEQHIERVVEIHVYNSDSDVVRVVALVPSYSWGGRGLLGAEVGTGYLHRLPNSCRSTIGRSVERKVRWMNKGTDAPTPAGQDAETAETRGGSGGDSTLLEMEPHLEMEVEKDGNNQNANPEQGTKQPHELGNSEEVKVAGPKSSQVPEPSQKPSNGVNVNANANAAPTITASSRSLEVPQVEQPPVQSYTSPAPVPASIDPVPPAGEVFASAAPPTYMSQPPVPPPQVPSETSAPVPTVPNPVPAPVMMTPERSNNMVGSPVKIESTPAQMSTIPIASPTTLAVASSADAEALFSGPPPPPSPATQQGETKPAPVQQQPPPTTATTTTHTQPTAGFSSYLPAPPKMTY